MNQHPDFFLNDPHVPLELQPLAMKSFFHILMGKKPEDYYVLPLSSPDSHVFEKESIYATLKVMQDKWLIIGYGDPAGNHFKGNHCIAIFTGLDKPLFFDSNKGLFQFVNLEALSYRMAKVLQGERFRWLISFSI